MKKGFLKSLPYNAKIAPYVFVVPFLFTFLLFFSYPIANSIIMSFQRILPGKEEFIGLANYARLNDPNFFKAMYNSAVYTLLTLIVLIPVPMLLAILLNSRNMIARNTFRAGLFMPALTSVAIAGIVFRLVFGDQPGAVANSIIAVFGYSPTRWFRNQNLVYFVMVLVATWRWTGVNMLYFFSGLQSIPKDIYESASLDGAGVMSQFRHITLPLLKPITIYVLTISVFGGMAMFTESYMLFNGNNSPGNMGLTIVGFLYRMGIEKNDLGYASAIGLTLMFITFTINIIQLNFFGMFKRKED